MSTSPDRLDGSCVVVIVDSLIVLLRFQVFAVFEGTETRAFAKTQAKAENFREYKLIDPLDNGWLTYLQGWFHSISFLHGRKWRAHLLA
jgi:hypothetical protein